MWDASGAMRAIALFASEEAMVAAAKLRRVEATLYGVAALGISRRLAWSAPFHRTYAAIELTG